MASAGDGERVVIAIPAIAPDSPPDEQDALIQAEAVTAALAALGYRPVTVQVTLDLAAARQTLQSLKPAFVFNLVEALGGQGRLIHLFPALLDSLELAYTGCSAEAQFITSGKLLAKRQMRAARIPTAPWIEAGDPPPDHAGPWIVKSVWEHASIGLDADAIIADPAAIEPAIKDRQARLGGDWFAERFIDGREFNLALLAGPEGAIVLPPAEMCFVDYPAGKPRIVDYAAKWHAGSFEFSHTVRNFDFPPADAALLAEIKQLALDCWRCFRLGGYARVDFRIDPEGRPWVLEINANPCISPDAGFTAATVRAGLDFTQVIARIVADRSPRPMPLIGGGGGAISSAMPGSLPRAVRT